MVEPEVVGVVVGPLPVAVGVDPVEYQGVVPDDGSAEVGGLLQRAAAVAEAEHIRRLQAEHIHQLQAEQVEPESSSVAQCVDE